MISQVEMMVPPEQTRLILGRDYRLGFLLVTPLLVLVLGLVAYPFLSAIVVSMTDKTIGREGHFIGLRNYAELLDDPFFRRAVINTIEYTALAVALKFLLGMGMALSLSRITKGRNIISGILIIPWMIPGIVVAVTWLWMYDPLLGVINYLLLKGGLVRLPPGWLGDERIALLSIIIVNVWRGFAFYGVTFAAGLKTIPRELYEAAMVDGAGPLQRFLYITVPGLTTVWSIVILLSTIWTFNDFVTVFVLTRGGPAGATHILGTLTHEIGIAAIQIGKGVAVSLYSLPLLVVVIVLYTRVMLRGRA